MKKIYRYLFLIISVSLLFSVYIKTEQANYIEPTTLSVTGEVKLSTGTQATDQEATMNVGDDDNLSTINGAIIEDIKGINDKSFTHDERVEKTINIIENLKEFFETEESTKLSDEDLQRVLDYKIVAKTNVNNINGTSVRIIRFDGLPELFGTLERKWTYIQWWNDREVYSQIIINKGAEVTDDFLFLEVKGAPTVILAGYQTIYNPYPIFLASWHLKDSEWKKVNLFSNDVVSNENWDIKVSENMATIESNDMDELIVVLDKQKGCYKVYSDVEQNKKLEFRFQGDQMVTR